jgi:molecular chaperone DnaJ
MDLYAVLGVNRAASDEQIERAFRRLARRYHPGVNPGDQVAAEMYRQIQDAYRVLSDAERRGDYDRRGHEAARTGTVSTTIAFEGFDFSASAEGPFAATFSELFSDVFHDAAREAAAPSRGADIEATLRISFEAAMRGGSHPLSVTRQERCPACTGLGRVSRAPGTCPACEGHGTRRWARGHLVFSRPCDVCGGGGRVTAQPCRSCGGAGLQSRGEVVTVAVPAGVEDGARLTVPGRGHAGARRGSAGDLYVTVEVAEHPFFRRSGRDLHVTLPVAVHEAALGARVDAPSLAGPIKVDMPAGTASGRQLRVRGRGVPDPGAGGHAGDLVLEVHIVLPSTLDARSKALLEEFGERNHEDVRARLFGDRPKG